MSRIEFWTNRQDGPIMVENIDSGEIVKFTQANAELIDMVLYKIKDGYPEAYAWLQNNYKMHKDSRFIMALRFLKCNFSENDKKCDIDEDGSMNVEDVHCPLKMEGTLCRAQNIICNPKLNTNLTPRELEYVPFLISGLSTEKIANEMCVSYFTVENTRKRIYRKLGFEGKAIIQLSDWAHKNNIVHS